jgi:hypothetical protein
LRRSGASSFGAGAGAGAGALDGEAGVGFFGIHGFRMGGPLCSADVDAGAGADADADAGTGVEATVETTGGGALAIVGGAADSETAGGGAEVAGTGSGFG